MLSSQDEETCSVLPLPRILHHRCERHLRRLWPPAGSRRTQGERPGQGRAIRGYPGKKISPGPGNETRGRPPFMTSRREALGLDGSDDNNHKCNIVAVAMMLCFNRTHVRLPITPNRARLPRGWRTLSGRGGAGHVRPAATLAGLHGKFFDRPAARHGHTPFIARSL